MTDLPLSESEFVRRLEEANRDRSDDPGWSFNDQQRRAVLYSDGPLHVTAGPGSGKNEVLVSRTLKLLLVDSVPPGSILLTTFTEKAAQSLEERIVDRLDAIGFNGAVDANDIRVGTLHSLCNDIMQEYRCDLLHGLKAVASGHRMIGLPKQDVSVPTRTHTDYCSQLPVIADPVSGDDR